MRLCDVETTEISSTNNVCADQQKRRHHWIFAFSRLADGLVKSEFKKCTEYKQNCISVEGVSKTMHEQTGHCNMTFLKKFFFTFYQRRISLDIIPPINTICFFRTMVQHNAV